MTTFDTYVKFRATEKQKHIIKKCAEKRGMKMSDFLRQLVDYNIGGMVEYKGKRTFNMKGLSDDEKEYMRNRAEKVDEEMHKFNIRRQWEKMNWVDWLNNRICEWRNDDGLSEEQIVKLLESHKPIAEIRGKKEELEQIKQSVKSGNYDFKKHMAIE